MILRFIDKMPHAERVVAQITLKLKKGVAADLISDSGMT